MTIDTSAKILRVFLNRWLDKAGTDTNRTLRKLVEFGYYFSGSLRQRKFFSEAKKILSDKNSQYYTLARCLFKSVKIDAAAEFGITFGYYGLVKAYKNIGDRFFGRENSGLIAGIIPGHNSETEKDNLSGQYQKLAQTGANAYFIFCDNIDVQENALADIIEKNPQKSFFLFTGGKHIALKYSQNNVMPILNIEDDNYDLIAAELKKQRRLFGGYCQYNDETADIITTKEFLDNAYERNCLFLFLTEEEGCSKITSNKINDFSYLQKRKPTHPIFITEIFGDLKWLNDNCNRKA